MSGFQLSMQLRDPMKYSDALFTATNIFLPLGFNLILIYYINTLNTLVMSLKNRMHFNSTSLRQQHFKDITGAAKAIQQRGCAFCPSERGLYNKNIRIIKFFINCSTVYKRLGKREESVVFCGSKRPLTRKLLVCESACSPIGVHFILIRISAHIFPNAIYPINFN